MTTETIPTRYRSALGDTRERAVRCLSCGTETYAFDALCDRCFPGSLTEGVELVITIDAGVITDPDEHRFAGTVEAGTPGTYAGLHPNLPNWLLVKVAGDLIATAIPEGLPDGGLVPVTATQVTKATA
jgi:hypothetical protein